MPEGRLDSWKTIAEYLGRDVRTVRRWEQFGLPIRRVPGGRGVSVFAFASEIDAWLKASGNEQSVPEDVAAPVPPAPVTSEPEPAPVAQPVVGSRRLGRWLPTVAAIVVVLAIIGAWRLRTPTYGAEDLRIRMTRDGISALDMSGAELWSHPFDPEYLHALTEMGEPWRLVAERHSAVYAAISHKVRRRDLSSAGGELLRFALDGTLERTFAFDDSITMNGRAFDPPWAVTGFAVEERADPPRVAVAAHHYTWSPSLVTVLDDAWRRKATFVHNGWIEWVFWNGPDQLLIGGFSDEQNAGVVGLLELSESTLRPIKLIAMPRTELNRVTASRFNRAVIERMGDRVIARTIEIPYTEHEATDVLYEYTQTLDLVRASFSARYWDEHHALELQHKLDHTRDACPDRDGPRDMRMWTPESGWSLLKR